MDLSDLIADRERWGELWRIVRRWLIPGFVLAGGTVWNSYLGRYEEPPAPWEWIWMLPVFTVIFAFLCAWIRGLTRK